jgi:hypothetical protein
VVAAQDWRTKTTAGSTKPVRASADLEAGVAIYSGHDGGLDLLIVERDRIVRRNQLNASRAGKCTGASPHVSGAYLASGRAASPLQHGAHRRQEQPDPSHQLDDSRLCRRHGVPPFAFAARMRAMGSGRDDGAYGKRGEESRGAVGERPQRRLIAAAVVRRGRERDAIVRTFTVVPDGR